MVGVYRMVEEVVAQKVEVIVVEDSL